MGLAPAGITPLLAWANEDDPHPCELWRMDGEKQWVLVRKAWMPWRATLPQRTWTPDGGLGDFLTWRKVSFFARIEDAGLEELRRGIHTWYTRRAKRDDTQIDSAEPRGDIEVHTDSDSAFDGLWMGFQTVSPWYHRNTYHVDTPADVRAILDMRQERVDRLRASAGLLEGRLSEAAREDRRAFEELFFAQMEEQKCVAPGTSPEHSWFWTHVASRALYR
ncbi:uncharacterized protein BJX67DRAFT_359084 [Aspergillus lucknowensis]|uniref:Uncharacterized protein n=1 Tax=Aspergillus lucknowensis TaxID=176173 RepID=A0ABR4LPE0_9EURO